MTKSKTIAVRAAALVDIALDRTSQIPLGDQLYRRLKKLILDGALTTGVRLPATRVFARDLSVSRNTVLAAYDQLAAEGYTVAQQGDGTRISPELPLILPEQGKPKFKVSGAALPLLPDRILDLPSRRSAGPSKNLPFLPGLADVSLFPFEEWGRSVGRYWRRPDMENLADRDIRGFLPLRQAIAGYLVAVRGLRCNPDQVIVTSGAQQGLDLCARVLLGENEKVIIETPGYRGFLSAFKAAGADVLPVSIDDEGLDIEVARKMTKRPRLVAVTPSHQFPLGVTMSLARRLALLEWARSAGFWVLEDDYDSEFRYRGKPLAALQGLDGGERVIYAGTFSKVMFPALRLGYLVVPDALVDPFLRLRGVVDEFPALAMQPTLAQFMDSGRFGAHVRRMRQVYAERQAALRDILVHRFAGRFIVPDDQAGMHLTVKIATQGLRDGDVTREASREGVIAQALSGYCRDENKIEGLVLGYAAFEASVLKSASVKLDQAMARLDKFGST